MGPTFRDAPVMPPGQPVQGASPGSSALAAALMGGGKPMNLPPPTMNIPLGSLQALMKPQVDPNTGMGTPSAMAGATDQQMAQQMAGTNQIAQQPGWLARMFGGGG